MSHARAFRIFLYSVLVGGLIITGLLQNVAAPGTKQDIEQIGSAERWKINYTLTEQDKEQFERSPQRWTKEFLEKRGQAVKDVLFAGDRPLTAASCFSAATGEATHLDPCTWVFI